MTPPRHMRVVCGSRALAAKRCGDDGTAQTWAYRLCLDAIGDTPPASVILTGGCHHCPDEWALFAASGSADERNVVEYLANGVRKKWICGGRFRDPKLLQTNDWRATTPPVILAQRKHPALIRDDAMACAAGLALTNGWVATGVAIVAPWSETHGAEYTADMLWSYDVPTWVAWCPSEATPPAILAAMREGRARTPGAFA